MDYLEICKVYEALESTNSGLKKTDILVSFLDKIKNNPKFIYLLRGKLFADYNSHELGISVQLMIKVISRASGISENNIVEKFKILGDLGLVAEEVLGRKKKQKGLFEEKLSVEKVIRNLKKLANILGTGAVDLKIGYVVDLMMSASAIEAKYIVRTVLGDLKVGVGVGTIRDAIAVYCFSPKDLEDKKICAKTIQEAYDKSTDFAEVFRRACLDELEKIKLIPDKPLKVMLFPKAAGIDDAFRIIGRPAAFEYKYDGFRVMINKNKYGEIRIFTRALENVTRQFPDIVEYVEKYVNGESFILDGEAVGFDSSTNKYTDFQAISQRIRRKHEINKIRKKLPVELVVFDIVYLDNDSLIDIGNKERRKILESIIREKDKKIILAKRIVTSDVNEVEKFYEKALGDGQEGLMGRRLDAPYKPGARIGYAVKLKPDDRDFDLVITGAEWGTGKRAGWLTSFDIACRNTSGALELGDSGARDDFGNSDLVSLGKVSTGLKELKSEGLSFKEMTDILEGLVLKNEGRHVFVKPEVVVSVRFQDVQKSPSNSSGFALRFPRILRLRPDRSVLDIASVRDIENEIEK